MNNNLNIYLFQRNLGSFDSYISENYQDELRTYRVDKSKIENVERGMIYVYDPPRPKAPDWKTDLEYFSQKKKLEIKSRTASSSAILFLTLSGEEIKTKYTVAITFGASYFLLNPETVVHDFGLKVSKGLLNSSELTSVDSTSLDRKVFNTRKQSTAFLLPEKILDVNSQTIFRNVQGRYREDDKHFSLGGSSSLKLRGNIDLSKDITDWINKFVNVYYDEKDNLGLVDTLKRVSKEKDSILDSKLAKKILKILASGTIEGRNVAGLKITPPTDFDTDEFKGFFVDGLGYKASPLTSEFFIDEVNFFNRLKSRLNVDRLNEDGVLSKLRTTNILIKDDREDKPKKICSIFQAINYDVNLEDKKYSLLNGSWYEVDKDFYDSICKVINNIKSPDQSAIKKKIDYINFSNSRDFNQKTNEKSEGKYNENLALKNKVLMLDRTKYIPNKDIINKYGINSRSNIEICDVFNFDEETIQFIHVKRHSGAAGTSHLLMQALGSANCFIKDREKVDSFINQKITEGNESSSYTIPKFAYRNQQKEAILAIVDDKYNGKQKNSDMLSLLELISISEAVQNLTLLGLNCYLKFIKTEE